MFFKTQNSLKALSVSKGDFLSKILADTDAVIVDVRTSGEYQSGHIKGAINIDVQQADFQTKIAILDKSKPYFVYCRSGARSGMAAAMMMQAGIESVFNLEGGIMNAPELIAN